MRDAVALLLSLDVGLAVQLPDMDADWLGVCEGVWEPDLDGVREALALAVLDAVFDGVGEVLGVGDGDGGVTEE